MFVSVFVLGFFVSFASSQIDTTKPTFRILAPEFVCPKDEDADKGIPDETVIMIQTSATSNLAIKWQVRWSPLPTPTQRFTLMLWRTIRELEAILNSPQKEQNVYLVDNTKFLHGVDFIFIAIATSEQGIESDPKTFHIDNSLGNTKLDEVDGKSFMMSVMILGGQMAYPDVAFIVEAHVTSCVPTEDYHFVWAIKSSSHELNFEENNGARLVVPPYTLKINQQYTVICQVMRSSNNVFVAKTNLTFDVGSRRLEIYLSEDNLIIAKNTPFDIDILLLNHDNYEAEPKFNWFCIYKGNDCKEFQSVQDEKLMLTSGLSNQGTYTIGVNVTVEDEKASAKMTVQVIHESLTPIIQIVPISRIVNEGKNIFLEANVTNVAPKCDFTWYFKKLGSEDTFNESCQECLHGTPLIDTLTINSLEENFLNELADFTNTTSGLLVQAKTSPAAGRARLVADCGCSLTFECDALATVYADVEFVLNESPKPGEVFVSPSSGTALQTTFRISTLVVIHPDVPLSYYFYCELEEPLLLAYYIDHTAFETILPYVEGGTKIYVEVCDVRGACSKGPITTVHLQMNDLLIDSFIQNVQGGLRRCEMMALTRLSAIVLASCKNAGHLDKYNKFSMALKELIEGRDGEICSTTHIEEYGTFLTSLSSVGFNSTSFD